MGLVRFSLSTKFLLACIVLCLLFCGCSQRGDTEKGETATTTPSPQVVDTSSLSEDLVGEFHAALNDGNDEKVKELLTKEPKLAYSRGPRNRTALQSGSSKLSVDTLGLLVEAGCPVDAGFKDGGGWSALHRAASAGRLEHLKFLLGHGADVDALSKMDRETALHEAAQYGRVEAVKALLAAGADPTIENRYGRTPLEHAKWFLGKEGSDKKDGQEQVIAHLEEVMKTAKPNPNAPVSPDHGLTYAASFADLDKIKAAVEAEPKLVFGYEKGGNLTTLLVIAAGSSKLDETVPVVAYLLEKGSDIQADDNSGRTALHRAAGKGNLKVIEMLLQAGADLEARDNDQMTPLFLTQDAETTQLLLDKGADQDAVAERGATMLHVAAQYGYPEKVKFLVEMGADTAAKNSSGETPLDLARKRKKTEIVEFLETKSKP